MIGRIDRIVLVGGGLAAAKAAETVRTEGFAGSVTLVTDEPALPYERPPLSKAVLLGEQKPTSAILHDRSFYDDRGIEVVTGDEVTAIDRQAGLIRTTGGRALPFDRLLLATGAAPRRLPLGEPGIAGVMTLRTMADSEHLAAQLDLVGHVTVVGAGWIGCEVAAAARSRGVEVTLVDPLDVPLQRVLGREIGEVFAQLHADHCVDLRLGVGVEGLTGGDRIEAVRLGDGRDVPTDLVVVGIGVLPRTGLAEAAGLSVDDGILVDETLATTDPRILAAGDVANAWHPFYERRLRVEHWANALHQGVTAGRNLLGAGERFERLPYFYSDQYDLGLEYAGHAPTWDDTVVRGSTEAREFLAFWRHDGRVVAGMSINVWDVIEDIRGIIRSGARVDPERLADPDVPLARLTAR